MSPFHRALVTIIVSLVVLRAGIASAADDKILKSFPCAPETRVTVRVTVGHVSISSWPRDEVSVEVVRRLPDGVGVERLPVHIEMEDGEVRVDARQPGDGKDAGLRADVTLRVPAQVSLPDIDLFEGRLELQGLYGTVTAKVERGAIVGRDVGGLLRLETTAGDITLDPAELSSEGLLRCRTFNGSVQVNLARRPANARVLLLTLNGSITSNLPLSERPGFGPRFREATIGPGQFLISVDVVRGDITLNAPDR